MRVMDSINQSKNTRKMNNKFNDWDAIEYYLVWVLECSDIGEAIDVLKDEFEVPKLLKDIETLEG